MEEIWKDIEGYEGKYQVSNLGNVRSLGYRNSKIVRNLQPKLNANYLFVHLRKQGVSKFPMVHRLVAKAFIPNPNNYPEVNHKDEDKHNNCVNNLEWCTRTHNITYGTIVGRIKETKKKLHRRCAEREVAQYDKLGNLISIYPSIIYASKVLGISPSCIGGCCRGTSKTYKGFIWKYGRD